jgi:hypothetical protein
LRINLQPAQRAFSKVKRAGRLVAIGAALGLAGAGVSTSSAEAYIVGQCAGPVWGFYQQDVCVHADMGGKNYANHTQWVGSVSADSPVGFNTFKEVWGDGFYRSGWGVNRGWWIGRWVRSGSGICAASNGFGPGDSREVACISIRV